MIIEETYFASIAVELYFSSHSREVELFANSINGPSWSYVTTSFRIVMVLHYRGSGSDGNADQLFGLHRFAEVVFVAHGVFPAKA